MIDKCSNDGIRTSSCPNCTLCGARGELLYQDLKDHLFGAPGKWNMKKCPNSDCGLIWLDPMPLEEDINKAYENYFTHQDTNQCRNTFSIRFSRKVMEAYWAKKYGYYNYTIKGWQKLIGILIYFYPPKHAHIDMKVMYLPAHPRGRLLDIGCGSGKWLQFMHNLGWCIEGVEIDPFVVHAAQKMGLPIHLGTLEAQKYPDNLFDAITLSHLIEHARDPMKLIQECYRIIKSGGKLVRVLSLSSG